MDGFTEEEDRFILEAGQNWPKKGKCVRLKNNSPLLSTRSASISLQVVEKRISRDGHILYILGRQIMQRHDVLSPIN